MAADVIAVHTMLAFGVADDRLVDLFSERRFWPEI
jgi:hypothetical protein